MDQISSEIVNTPRLDVQYYANSTVDFFTGNYPQIFAGGQVIVGYVVGLSLVLSFLLVFGIIFCVESLKSIRKREDKIYNGKPEEPKQESVQNKGNADLARKWEQVQNHIISNNPNDWRQAIIEADIMLGDLLISLGYKGMTIGEQLKRVASGDFKTVDKAIEAHAVRNRIAHDGSEFQLNSIEAQRVINLYKSVFEEFFHI